MSQRPSFWFDTRIYLAVSALLILIICFYNLPAAVLGVILLWALYLYGRERYLDRQQAMNDYMDAMSLNVGQASLYALQNLPLAIAIIEQSGRLYWRNGVLSDWSGMDLQAGDGIQRAWPQIDPDGFWGRAGLEIFTAEGEPLSACLQTPD